MADLSQFLVSYKKDERLFSEGDLGDEMFFIHGGKVRIEKKVGGVPHTLAVLEKGDFFGEMSLLENEPRAADAVVEEDAALLKINAENFSALLSSNVEIAIRMIRKYIERVRLTNKKLEEVIAGQQSFNSGVANIIENAKASVMPRQKLRLVERQTKEAFELPNFPALIGRIDPVTNQKPDVDMTVLDQSKSTSRRHARIMMEKGDYFIAEEVGVANGTYVNGQRLLAKKSVPIKQGDIIRVGNLEFIVEVTPLN